MIRLDFTQESVVIVCEPCVGVWVGFAFDKLDAWERAAAHEERTHPGTVQARDALRRARRSPRSAS